jgi:hypothetical protein
LFPVSSMSGRARVRDVTWLTDMSGRLVVSVISCDTLHCSTPVFASTCSQTTRAALKRCGISTKTLWE